MAQGRKKPVQKSPAEGTERLHPALIPYFGYCLSKSAMRLKKRLTDEMELIGVQPPQIGLMFILSISGPLNQISLCEEMAIDKATMVKVLDQMEQSELVLRKPSPHDRRVKLVELTPKGRKLVPKMMKIRNEVEAKFLAPLTKSEAAELQRLITKVLRASG